MQYQLKILSPLHIGCGEEYNGLSYLADKGKLFYFEPDRIFAAIGQKEALRFATWIAEKSRELEVAEQRIKREKEYNKKKHLKDEKKKLLREFTLKKYLQNLRFNFTELLSRATYEVTAPSNFWADQTIIPCIKQAARPYVPGSEIKGAIRTAVLYTRLLNDASLQEFLEAELKKFLADSQTDIKQVANQQRPDRRQKTKLNKAVARIEGSFQAKALRTKNDAKFDLLKFLAVGDSELLDSVVSIKVASSKPVNVSRPFTINYEYLKPDLMLSLPGTGLEDEKSRKVKLAKMAADGEARFKDTVENFLACCHAFASDLLQTEKEYFRLQGKTGVVAHLSEIEKQNTPDSPVLRIGKDEGFFSLTMGMAIKKLWPDLYKNALIHATTGKSYDDQHGGLLPKTRKLVQWANNTELTAGWVKLMPPGTHNRETPQKKAETRKSKESNSPLDVSSLLEKFGKKGR
ncbi:MAG: type III-A CRISPR-associated RAMP protein Csm5 [Desulfobulbaceae bacterium DB1]|nr:MAG: type III-A CRISPR-associated RAMP protein Csm5 [Desulfobulbaceae bacterium DB1]